MKKVIVLQHQNRMIYSKEFLQMKVPKELRVLLYSILVLFGVAICLITFGKVDDVIQANGIIGGIIKTDGIRTCLADSDGGSLFGNFL